jgi:hypothetical protein
MLPTNSHLHGYNLEAVSPSVVRCKFTAKLTGFNANCTSRARSLALEVYPR